MKKSDWIEDFKKAKEVLKPFNGELLWVLENYIAFRFKSNDISLVFYPHKTSAGNYHLRVRNENSKNKKLATKALIALSNSVNSCTFSVKSWPIVSV